MVKDVMQRLGNNWIWGGEKMSFRLSWRSQCQKNPSGCFEASSTCEEHWLWELLLPSGLGHWRCVHNLDVTLNLLTAPPKSSQLCAWDSFWGPDLVYQKDACAGAWQDGLALRNLLLQHELHCFVFSSVWNIPMDKTVPSVLNGESESCLCLCWSWLDVFVSTEGIPRDHPHGHNPFASHPEFLQDVFCSVSFTETISLLSLAVPGSC